MISLLLAFVYIAFISLGLPDSLIAAAWPVISVDLGVSVSLAGVISIAVCIGTIISSFLSGWLIRKIGVGKVVAFSVLLTALGIFFVAVSPAFWTIMLAAIPMGIGGGAIDSGLNNFVALNFKPIHMNFLHAFWGIGAFFAPVIISMFLVKSDWRHAAFLIAGIQFFIAILMFASLPLWNKYSHLKQEETVEKQFSIRDVRHIKGAGSSIASFLTYCAVEQLIGLWGSSFLVKSVGLSASVGARTISVYYLSLAIGRLLCGFFSLKLSNKTLIIGGLALSLVGITGFMLPLTPALYYVAFAVTGLGFASVYPCTVQETPVRFGTAASQTIIGVQVGCAYIGAVTIPPLFGVLFAKYAESFGTLLYGGVSMFFALLTLWLVLRTARLTKPKPKEE